MGLRNCNYFQNLILNKKIEPLKEVVHLCDDIETRLPKIKKNLEEVKD